MAVYESAAADCGKKPLTWQEPGKGEPLPVIRVNQLGYAPKLPKKVVVTAGGDYVLTDANGATVKNFP